MSSRLFVTGTDTEVGKTAMTATMAWHLRQQGVDVGVMKPVETGYAGAGWPPDAWQLSRAAGSGDARDAVVPFVFAPPVAPWAATKMTNQPVPWDKLAARIEAMASKHPVLLVEGAGGLAVPVDAQRTMADMARLGGCDLVVVARSRLGTINHTVLTVEYARSRGLSVAGIIINRYAGDGADPSEALNPEIIYDMTGVPIWGVVPEITAPRGLAFYQAAREHLDWPAINQWLGTIP